MSLAISDDSADVHFAEIIHYCEDVTSGRRQAGKLEKLSVERFLRDLQRTDWDWVFSPSHAARYIEFCQRFPHVKGRWARQRGRAARIRYEPWQKFIVGNLFGWVHRKTGLRRFIEAYIRVARKNAKSTMAAQFGLYMLASDSEPGAEVYCGATSKDQAKEVFQPARLMAKRQPHYLRYYGVTVNVSNIVRRDESKFVTVIGKPGDGSMPHAGIVDEYHEHPTTDQYDTFKGGMTSREQPLIWVITTAGDNIEGPCHVHDRECQKVLEGTIQDDRLFVVVYQADEEVEWDSDLAIEQANPGLGVSVDIEILRTMRDQARRSPEKRAHYETKHLNRWVGSRQAWCNMELWNKAARDIKREDFAGYRNVAALDLASKIDVAARLDVYEYDEPGELPKYVAFPRFWLPSKTARDKDNPNYQRYKVAAEQGWLTITDGDIIDQRSIEDDTVEQMTGAETEVLGYDERGATYLAQRLQDDHDLAIEQIPQTTKFLSEPMKWIEAFLIADRIIHDGNPLMAWMMSNVEVKPDANENIFPRKPNKASKIDGPVALIMCLWLLLGDRDLENLDDFLSNPIT